MPDHNYVHIPLPPELAQHVLDFAVEAEHLIEREKHPHLTLKFGTDATYGEAKEALKDERPAKVRFGTLSVFQKPDSDVLKIEVTSADLHRLHRKLNRLPHDDSHPLYVPHVTVAYLVRGTGRNYSGKTVRRLSGRTALFRSAVFKSKDGHSKEIPLEPEGTGEREL